MKRLLTFAFAFLAVLAVQGQDASFTQFWANPLYLNPAFAGNNNILRISGTYRNHWRYTPGRFDTYSAGIDMRLCNPGNIGIGALFVQDVEGEGLLTSTEGSFIFNYLIEKPDHFQIAMALQPRFIQKSIHWDNLVFSDQLDPVLGDIYTSGAEPPQLDSRTFFDAGAGIMLRFFSRLPNRREDMFTNVGLSVQHLFEPNESLLGDDSRLPLRATLHAGSIIPIGGTIARKPVYLVPNGRLEMQRFRTGLSRSLGAYDLGAAIMRQPFLIGANYHSNLSWDTDNERAVALLFGLKSVFANSFNYYLGYSYDMNVGGIRNSRMGVHEITLHILLEDICFIGGRFRGGRGGSFNGRNCFDFSKKGIVPIF